MASVPAFPNYTQIPRLVPAALWRAGRVAVVAATAALVVFLVREPERGLFIFWRLAVPLLPLVWLAFPGAWRNLCPMSSLNQASRVGGFSLGKALPKRLKEKSYVVGMLLFFGLASSRKWLFNESAPATALLIGGALALAFIGGIFFKGKSGWCSAVCPLLPVQRLYGQTPFVLVANAHCSTCVGCAKNCYDFNPSVAALADLYDDDPRYAGYRKFFAAVFPGFILAFYTAPVEAGLPALYGRFALFMAASLGSYYAVRLFSSTLAGRIPALYAAAAFNIFYWFNAPLFLQALGVEDIRVISAARGLLMSLSAFWLARTFMKEGRFLAQVMGNSTISVSSRDVLSRRLAAKSAGPQVIFQPGDKKADAEQGRSLLETAEKNGIPLEAGCRMGVCGADPVTVTAGMENLSPCSADEKATLERLGRDPAKCRLACSARVKGPVTVSLAAETSAAAARVSSRREDPAVRRVVVLGNGIAGVTAADHVRRLHGACEVHVVGRETHPLYNRMGIGRLVYGRSAMKGLYLLPETWYDDNRVTAWLNTRAERISVPDKKVFLATGETLEYDRLILATGARARTPEIPGFGHPGTFVLREAADAMNLRSFIQQEGAKRAVVSGGGLLGLETAYALHKLGLDVTCLERGAVLLRRQMDEAGGKLLQRSMEALGVKVLLESEAAEVEGLDRARRVVLKDGRVLPCDVFVACVGIAPEDGLAKAAGLKVDGGVVVSDALESSAPDIFAVGDAAKVRGRVHGLWPAAVSMGETAAWNAVSPSEERKPWAEAVPVTLLKVTGVDLLSAGRVEAGAGDTVAVWEDARAGKYRKFVVSEGKLVGAILLGEPAHAAVVSALVKEGRPPSALPAGLLGEPVLAR